jgi:CheY-like chemotaxis protein/HPt (histidine-containing phosphotransfer) domain-containing protein
MHTARGREHAAIGPVSQLEPAATGRGGERGRVLVAEDNEINQIAAMRMLTKLGFHVDIAHDGGEAVHLSERARYAAIFMDCQMPELDGYQATALIREREGEEHHTPIIALTANTITGDRERCLAAGMDEYMPKPLRYEHLTELCARILGDGTRASSPELAVVSSASGVDALFDPAGVESMVGVDQARSVLALFLDQLDSSLPDLAAAIAGEDRETARQIAHKLKGSASVIGARALTDACEELCAGSREEAADLQPPHAGMQKAAAATIAVIRAHLDRLAPAAETCAWVM